MYYLDLATGMRRGELLGLKWSDIDFAHGIIHIRRQISRIDGVIREMPLKTKNSYRNVPISDNAVEMLKEMKTHSSSDYVFSSPAGGPISPDSVNNMTGSGMLGRVRTPQNRSHCQMWQC